MIIVVIPRLWLADGIPAFPDESRVGNKDYVITYPKLLDGSPIMSGVSYTGSASTVFQSASIRPVS